MPSSVKVPWSQPIANPVATRVPANIVVPRPADSAIYSFVWSWPGRLNYIENIFPDFPAPRDLNIYEAVIIQKRAGSTLAFDVYRSGAEVLIGSFTANNAGTTIRALNIDVSAYDRVNIRPTSIGTGNADIVTIALNALPR